jgi:hypothetical protein
LEISEFFQRYYDLEYVGWNPLKRSVGIWTYKAWAYCGADGFNDGKRLWEDMNFITRIKSFQNNNQENTTMYHDGSFVWAVDNSTDRWIAWMINWYPYHQRYNTWSFWSTDKTKDIEWNNRALKNKGNEKTKALELTTENLKKNLWDFYRQRFYKIWNNPNFSNSYKSFLTQYKLNNWKTPNDKIKKEKILSIINPIMQKILERSDFMGLDSTDYDFVCSSEYSVWNKDIDVIFNESTLDKIKKVQKQKVKNWYYDYRK